MRLSNPWRMGLLFVISGAGHRADAGPRRPGARALEAAAAAAAARHGGDRAAAVLAAGARAVRLRRRLSRLPAPVLQRATAASATARSAWRCRPGTTCGSCPTCGAYTLLCCWHCALPRMAAARSCGGRGMTGAMVNLRAAHFGVRPVGQPRGLCGWRLLLVLLVFLAAVRVLLFPRFGETHALLDDWAAHAAYAAAVRLRRAAGAPAGAAGRSAGPALAGAGAGPGRLGGAGALPRAAARLAVGARGAAPADAPGVCGAAQWGGIVAAFGFARRHLDVDHRWRAPLTEAVFPLYLVHQTVIIVAAVALRPLSLPAGVGGGGDRGADFRRRLVGLAVGAARRVAAAVDGAVAASAGARASACRNLQRLNAQALASRGPGR